MAFALSALVMRGRLFYKATREKNSANMKGEAFMMLVIILVWALVHWAIR